MTRRRTCRRRPTTPRRLAPRGIVWSVVISVIFGFILLVAMNVGITPDKIFTGTDGTMVDGYTHALQSATGVPPVQIWIDAVGQSLGMVVLLLVIGAQFFCGMSSVTANSRMIYAFSRDGAVPASRFWHRINKRTRTPTNSIWLAAVGAFILGLPYLYSPVAYAAITSIAVIGLYVAYIAPVFLRLRAGDKFVRRPVDPRSMEPADRDRGDDLGGLHLLPVHAAAGVPDHDQHLQLHAGGVPRRPRWRGDLVLRLGQELVQGPQGPGHRRGASRSSATSRSSDPERGRPDP